MSVKSKYISYSNKQYSLLRNISYNNFSKEPENDKNKNNQLRKKKKEIYEAKRNKTIQETIQRMKNLKFSNQKINEKKTSENLSKNYFQKIIELKELSKEEILTITKEIIKNLKLLLIFNVIEKDEKLKLDKKIKKWESLQKMEMFNDEFAKLTLEINRHMVYFLQNVLNSSENSPFNEITKYARQGFNSDFIIHDTHQLAEIMQTIDYLLLEENLLLYTEMFQKIIYKNDKEGLQFQKLLKEQTDTFEQKVKELYDKSMEFIENNPDIKTDQKIEYLTENIKEIYTLMRKTIKSLLNEYKKIHSNSVLSTKEIKALQIIENTILSKEQIFEYIYLMQKKNFGFDISDPIFSFNFKRSKLNNY